MFPVDYCVEFFFLFSVYVMGVLVGHQVKLTTKKEEVEIPAPQPKAQMWIPWTNENGQKELLTAEEYKQRLHSKQSAEDKIETEEFLEDIKDKLSFWK